MTTVERADEPAIAVEDLSVVYRFRLDRPTLRSLFRGLKGGSTRQIQALEGVSFSVPRGSILGVIGKNGAGKSTLLRVIAGILPPSKGRVVVRGEVTPLLSLGTGFNRHLTGRENIMLGTLAMGMSEAEAKDRFDDVVGFADLGEFIDYPVSSYSSGMRSRLGFSVVAHLRPEILLIDETLGAGDASFKEKCRERMEEMCGEGRTVVVVSHGMGTILELSSHCLWLHQGKAVQHGAPQDVVEAYMRFSRVKRQGLDDESVIDDWDSGDDWGGSDG